MTTPHETRPALRVPPRRPVPRHGAADRGRQGPGGGRRGRAGQRGRARAARPQLLRLGPAEPRRGDAGPAGRAGARPTAGRVARWPARWSGRAGRPTPPSTTAWPTLSAPPRRRGTAHQGDPPAAEGKTDELAVLWELAVDRLPAMGRSGRAVRRLGRRARSTSCRSGSGWLRRRRTAASTPSRPTTEMIVSITDQLLIVSPTVIPKYSLTSQKPGVVDVREEQRAGADGQREQRDGGAVQAGGQRGDDAGGGDRRDRRRAGGQPDADGDQPAEHQRRDVERPRPVADEVADAGVDQHLLEAAAGGDDEQDAGDRRQRAADGRRRSSARPKPTAVPSVNIARMTPISSAIIGVPRTSSTVRRRAALVEGELADGPQQHEHDRQQDGGDGGAERRSRAAAPRRPCRPPVRRPPARSTPPRSSDRTRRAGRRRSSRLVRAGRTVTGRGHGRAAADEAAEHRPGEDHRTGWRTIRPKSRVRPRSACRASMATSGPGCGGTRPCSTDRPARAGMPTAQHRQPRAAGDEQHDRDEQDDADLEEQRDADQRRHPGHRPRQPARGHPVDERGDHPVGAAGLGEQAADHRAEGDQHARRCRRSRRRRSVKLVTMSLNASPATTPEHRRAQDQRQERVHLQPGDEQDDDGDAEQGGERRAAPSCWCGRPRRPGRSSTLRWPA